MAFVNKNKIDRQQSVGQTYGERAKAVKSNSPALRPQAPAKQHVDKFVGKSNKKNLWRVRPKAASSAKHIPAGKHTGLLAVEEGANEVVRRPSAKACVDLCNKILATPSVHTSNSIRKAVTEKIKKSGHKA